MISQYIGRNTTFAILTCSSKESDDANLRELALASLFAGSAFLVLGLSGGESSEDGVRFVFAVDWPSESSINLLLSNIGSIFLLPGDSDMDVQELC